MRKIFLLILLLILSASIVDARAPIPKRFWHNFFVFEYTDIVNNITAFKPDAVFLDTRTEGLNNTMVQSLKNIDTAYGTKLQVYLWFGVDWDHKTGEIWDLCDDTNRTARVQYIRNLIESNISIDGVYYEELDVQHGYPPEKAPCLNKFWNETRWIHDEFDINVGTNQASMNFANLAVLNGFDYQYINNNRSLDFVVLQNGDPTGWNPNWTQSVIDVRNNWAIAMPNVSIISNIYQWSAATNTYCYQNGGHGAYSYPTCFVQPVFEIINYYNRILGASVSISQTAELGIGSANYHWNSAEPGNVGSRMLYWNGTANVTYNLYPSTDRAKDIVGRIPITNYNGSSSPIISVQPINKTDYVGASVSFYVGATGGSPISYQWQRNETNITNAINSSYSLTLDLSYNYSRFRVLVSNPNGSTFSNNATVIVLPSSPINITVHPSNATVFTGSSNLFAVTVTGSTPIYYQWQKNGTNISGATNSSYMKTGIAITDNQSSYRVIVWNIENSNFSNNATLTVNEQPPLSNIINNSGFDNATKDPWGFYSDMSYTEGFSSPGFEGSYAFRVNFTSGTGTNTQLSQSSLTLKNNTQYRFSFAGYSNTGHNVSVSLFKPTSPYPNYGLSQTYDLGTSWQTFTTDFNTTGFTGTVNDGRLRFWLVGQAVGGDIYYFDNIKLYEYTTGTNQTNTSPIISNISVGTVGQTHQVISYDVNQTNAVTNIQYSTSADMLGYQTTTLLSSGTSRTQNLTGLNPHTYYYFQVFGYNNSDQSMFSNSSIQSFATLSDHNETDSYNVSRCINNSCSWYNGSSSTFLNTSIGCNDCFVNDTIYAWNNTGGLSTGVFASTYVSIHEPEQIQVIWI